MTSQGCSVINEHIPGAVYGSGGDKSYCTAVDTILISNDMHIMHLYESDIYTFHNL